MNSNIRFAPPPEAPEAPKRHERASGKPKSLVKPHEGRGLSLRPSQSSASSRKPDLRRALGSRETRDSGFTVKSTISDNRTGNSHQRLLSALDKSCKPLYFDPEDCISAIEIVIRRTKFGRSAVIEALSRTGNDIENAIWDLSRAAAALNAWATGKTDSYMEAARIYIENSRKEGYLHKPKFDQAPPARTSTQTYKPYPSTNRSTEPVAGPNGKKETALYSHLVRKTQELNIDVSGSSIHSAIFRELLQNIVDLEKHREDLSRQLQSNPFTPTPRLLKDNDQPAVNPTTEFTFGLEFYNDSPQSIFYTELHNIRRKLNYEIDFLEGLVAKKERPLHEGSSAGVDVESVGGRDDNRGGDGDETKVDEQPTYDSDSEGDKDPILIRRRAPGMLPAPPRRINRNDYSDDSDDNGGDQSDSDQSKYSPRNNEQVWLLIHTAFGYDGHDSYDRESPDEIIYVRVHGSRVSSPHPSTFSMRNFRHDYNVSFIIERQYDYYFTSGVIEYDEKMFLRQTIKIISEPLKEFLEPFKPYQTPPRHSWDVGLVLFHRRHEIKQLAETNEGPTSALVQQLLDATEADYEEATALFKQGLVTRSHLNKLFFSRTVLVSPGDPIETFRCDTRSLDFKPERGIVLVEASRWLYDGQFYLSSEVLTIKAPRWPSEIRGLRAYPLSFASPEIQELVAKRSQTYWMYRQRSFVSYSAPGQIQRTQGPSNYRFMIDYETYRELHPDADEFTNESIESAEPMTEEDMKKDSPPGNGLELVFPAKISGFSIQDKKWIDYITPVTWNKVAFDRLVLKPVAKELIQAVVDVHDTKEKSADLMQGKGNGSLILLHGPPGTGKTLTAESVAELVQRPLYRVTCGDVGTDPESVENYLEAVLYIGKIWGCVVLLDEADVFLEERTLTDLHRNALVSVFLRVLEYYDGILILTSNRVGTFDEAFKSRIKLALHYTALEKADRRKIWRNFFKTLKETDPERVDFDDLDDHLDDLASIKLNGRDIRNAIAVSRELAQFRKNEKMNFEHIRHVIGIGEEFEKYLDKTNGYKADAWLRENGIRA
ncbi:hypothetical protein PT974_00921 [Cladobotryum mycophilum]|uniref:AAA+ ATPase domain-containing protein n=1 Tax=Cladobotryum mycophilum TaxID=491253 RepID=A0ABR0T3I0_9HYPO